MSLADGIINALTGKKEDEKEIYKFFSYSKMREAQRVGIPKVREFLIDSHDKMFILKGPTGCAKESIVITSAIQALTKGAIDKIILVVPTISARNRDTEEIKLILKKWGKQLPKNFLAVVMASKQELCEYKDDVKDVYQLCEAIVPAGECPYYNELKKNKSEVNTPTCIDFNNPNDIKIFKGACPYYLQLDLARKASLVVCDFNYIVQPVIRERIKLATGKTLIIFNEAHLLPERAMFTNSLHYSTIDKAIKEAKKYRMSAVASELKMVQRSLKRLVGSHSNNIAQDRFEKRGEGVAKISYHEFSKAIDDLDGKIQLFKKHGNEIVKKKFKAREKSFSSIGQVSGFLETVEKYSEHIINGAPNGKDSKMLWVSENNNRENDIGFGMTNTIAFVPLYSVFDNTHKMIFMSATLFEEWLIFMLGLYKWRSLLKFESLPYSFPKQNRTDVVIPHQKIMRSNLKGKLIDDVAKEVLKLCKSSEKPIDIITTNGIYNKLRENLGGKLKIYEIPKGVKSLKNRLIVIENLNTSPYSTMSPYSWPSVSIDIPKIRTTIVVGVCVARMNAIARTIITNYAKREQLLGASLETAEKKAHHMVMTLAAILKEEQAVGRFQRTDRDRIKIFWLDSRYGDYPHSLLPFIRQYFYGMSEVRE